MKWYHWLGIGGIALLLWKSSSKAKAATPTPAAINAAAAVAANQITAAGTTPDTPTGAVIINNATANGMRTINAGSTMTEEQGLNQPPIPMTFRLVSGTCRGSDIYSGYGTPPIGLVITPSTKDLPMPPQYDRPSRGQFDVWGRSLQVTEAKGQGTYQARYCDGSKPPLDIAPVPFTISTELFDTRRGLRRLAWTPDNYELPKLPDDYYWADVLTSYEGAGNWVLRKSMVFAD